jgi:1-acyl-sn-glycerol-3-phosphate acyltransferase
MLRFASKLLLKVFGWKSVGSFPSGLKKYVVIVAPHTSGWDFVIGLLFRKALRLEKVKYLGKQELFRPPFGFFFRWLGGTPVDRSTRHNLVDQVVAIFHAHEEFAIALSPEGTRQRVDKLKTGFYNIAQAANVPLIMVAFDYANKRAVISEPVILTGDQATDLTTILNFFRPIQGKYPEKGLMHL